MQHHPSAMLLAVHGLGLTTDTFPSAAALAAALLPPVPFAPPAAAPLDPAAVASHDPLTQLALRAAHDALTAAGLLAAPAGASSGDRLGLLFVTAWGTIDATVGYLDSMLDAAGRYASPRHFSRSVYSAVASAVAIHFKIHGPCETLSFPEAAVPAALRQARRLLAAGRADRVLVVWADQSAAIARDLAARAVGQLHRREYARYLPDLGQGAVGLVVGLPDGSSPATLDLAQLPALTMPATRPPQPPFPSDAALALAAGLLARGDLPLPRP
jgi:3-oxoacyl-[acyl-carrier-protein] synthase II